MNNIVKLGDIADFINGFAFKPSDWNGNGKKIIRIQNLTDPTKPYNSTDKPVDTKYVVHKGDVLVSWSATLGVFEWKEDSALLNQHIFKVVPDESTVIKPFLKYSINQAINKMMRYTHGSTMKHINRREFLDTDVYLPGLLNQEKIVKLLDKADALRQKRGKSIKLLDEFLRSTFLEMFEDLFINPLKWEVEQLKKLCHFENGDRGKNYPSKDSFVDEGIPFVNAGNLTDGIIDENYLNYITNEKYEKLSSGKIQKGDILFCLRGSLGKFALNNKLTKGAIASSLVIIRPSEKVNVEFLVHFFKSKYCKKLIKESDNGSAQPNLSAASVKSFQLPLPPIDLQNKFADISKQTEKLKAKYKESEKELNNLFGSLMQRAFKGELT